MAELFTEPWALRHDCADIFAYSGSDDAQPAMRFAAPIFFGNAATLSNAIGTAVRDAPNPVSALILEAEGATDVDVTGAAALRPD